MFMEEFLKIKSVFGSIDERTINRLYDRYNDYKFLVSTIRSLLEESISINSIKDKRILIKPNWVKHSIRGVDELCLRTNDKFLLAALDVVLSFKPSEVVIGDAPVQGCNWAKIISKELHNGVNNLSKVYNIPVFIKDFRRTTFRPSQNNPSRDLHPIADYIVFDVGNQSYLEPITLNNKNVFRVTSYNPDMLADTHKPGVHKYCITKELFHADFILSIPKVKTHQKAGITAALKNIVGINGDKDFLPHHRIGGTGRGGDCYPGNNILRYWAELALDEANRVQGRPGYRIWQKVSSALWTLSIPQAVHHIAAGWYGNDTCWRMVLDLNNIALYGKKDGTFSNEMQRQVFSLCDGIVGGQGDGPLKPDPLPLGMIGFTNQSVLCDIAFATLMRFDFRRIPLLKVGAEMKDLNKMKLYFNEKKISMEDLKQYSIQTLPPPGWTKHLTQ